MSKAVCDPDAFYPLRSLVKGPLKSLEELGEVERLLRAVVLHDEIFMVLEPMPYDPAGELEIMEEKDFAGPRNILTAIGPVLADYDFFTDTTGPGKPQIPNIPLSQSLLEVARDSSNATEGNAYYNTHVDFLKRVIGITREGGSAILSGHFGTKAIITSSRYPDDLFKSLNQDWQNFAREAADGSLQFMIPPILSIVLTRCARREAIPAIIKDLRDEWADARAKVWARLDELKTADNIDETRKIQAELSEVTQLLSPKDIEYETLGVRVLWDLIAVGLGGVAIAQLAAGNPVVGGASAALALAARAAPTLLHKIGPALFGRGAFDLGKRVRRELLKTEYDSLSKLLSESEKRKLGLS